MMEDAFVDNSEKSERLCSVCNELKPLTDFYKDGTASDGSVRYRRDCKLCYRATRIKTRRSMKATIPKRGGITNGNKKRV